MKHQQIRLECGPGVARRLVDLLRDYTEVAFPAHSTDCAQVAREAMLGAIASLESRLLAEGRAEYSKRLRAMFREAVKMHFELHAAETGECCEARTAALHALCGGEALADADYAAAETRDRAAGHKA